MAFKKHVLISFLLLATLSSCSWLQKKPEAKTESTPQSSAPDTEIPVTPVPPTPEAQTSSSPSPSPAVVAKSLDSQKNAPSAEKEKEQERSTTPKAETPESQELPKLSPENEKIVSNITNEVSEKSGVVTENSGLITMNRLLIAQQAQWLISGSFSKDFKALEPNLPQETDEYKFEITQGNDQEAIVVAIAKNNKLPSFTGASFAIPSGLPTSGLCQTKLPSQTSPTPPKLNGSDMVCGNDGVLVVN